MRHCRRYAIPTPEFASYTRNRTTSRARQFVQSARGFSRVATPARLSEMGNSTTLTPFAEPPAVTPFGSFDVVLEIFQWRVFPVQNEPVEITNLILENLMRMRAKKRLRSTLNGAAAIVLAQKTPGARIASA